MNNLQKELILPNGSIIKNIDKVLISLISDVSQDSKNSAL